MIKYVFFQRYQLRPPTFESPWIHRGWTPANGAGSLAVSESLFICHHHGFCDLGGLTTFTLSPHWSRPKWYRIGSVVGSYEWPKCRSRANTTAEVLIQQVMQLLAEGNTAGHATMEKKLKSFFTDEQTANLTSS